MTNETEKLIEVEVLHAFVDKHTGTFYGKGEKISLTEERINEIIEEHPELIRYEKER